MKHIIKHSLGKDKCIDTVKSAIESYSSKYSAYSPKAQWKDNVSNVSFSAKGMSIKGTICVNDNDIEVDLEVPFLLRPFKDKAISIIDSEIKKCLAETSK